MTSDERRLKPTSVDQWEGTQITWSTRGIRSLSNLQAATCLASPATIWHYDHKLKTSTHRTA